MFFKKKTVPPFQLQFSSELLSCNGDCQSCEKPCDYLKRKDIRFLYSKESTGFYRWDILLSKINTDGNVCIVRADIIKKPRKECVYVLEGWFIKNKHTFDFEIQFDTFRQNGWISIIGG